MVYESLNELYFALPLFEKDPEKQKEEMAKKFEEKIMPMLSKFNAKHANDPEKGNKDHFIGGKLTLADISLAFFMGEMKRWKPDIMEALPALAGIVEATNARPNIKAWLESREQTPF
jgi:glutathione S-transferase